jgi:undecaprenyl-diphosphatase
MTPFQAVLLGVVQGLTEFLPISSSAHLILVPWLFRFPDPGLTFDAALHLGTLLGIVAFLWRDWLKLLGSFIQSLKRWDLARDHNQALVWMILAGTIPGGVAGVLFEDVIEHKLRAPWLVASLLILMGLVLWYVDRTSRKSKGIAELRWHQAIAIGIAQVLALAPGVSRSGITITTGLLAGLKREDAARFSFLLATPIIFGAGVFKVRHLVHGFPPGEAQDFVLGVLSAAIVGYFAVWFLLRYLQKHSLSLFVWYRLLLGALILVVFFLRG